MSDTKRWWVLTLGLAAVLIGLAAVPSLAAADGAASFFGRAGRAARAQGFGPMMGGARIGPLDDKVASLLGMSVADLRTARQSGKSLAEIAADKGISRDTLVSGMLQLHQDAVAARVADGTLTQAQADQVLANMKTRIEAMVDGKGFAPGRGPQKGGLGIGPLHDQVASLLGMSLTDLQTARQSGKSLAEIAADKGINRDTLVAGMLKAHQEALAARVADGSLTPAQADQMLASMKTRIEAMVDVKAVGPAAGGRGGFGRGRGRGGMGRGPGFGQPSNQNTGLTNS